MYRLIKASTVTTQVNADVDKYPRISRDAEQIQAYKDLAAEIKSLRIPHLSVVPKTSYVRLRYAAKIKPADYDRFLAMPEIQPPTNSDLETDISNELDKISQKVAYQIANAIDGIQVEILIADYNQAIRWDAAKDGSYRPIDDISFLMHVVFE